jgi:hypothetical protein
MRAAPLLISLFLALCPSFALAEAPRDRFSAGGYFRVMTRPDFEGGNSRLGYWNLYGRLLNEGPWGALELKLDALTAQPGSNEVWASIHSKLEGGSFANTDPSRGRLDQFGVTQLYIKAGNVLLDRVTWQVGTLESYFGDLGLYDMRPSSIFFDTVGLSARYQTERFDLLLGVGDSGYALRGPQYNTLLTGGGTLRVRLGSHLELGAGGQLAYEPEVTGNRFAPHAMSEGPDGYRISYEDVNRGEVLKRYFEENPGREELFPKPSPTSALSYKAIGYLGFGDIGPLRWNNLYVSWRRVHPENFTSESAGGREYLIYLKELTDERVQLLLGNELQLRLLPGRLDAAWGVLYGREINPDNRVAPGEDNRTYLSTVLRLQLYLTHTVHLLAESSLAEEKSLLGNLYREHADSIFRNTGGLPDSRGLELGETDTRRTWQLKAGVVLNPTGLGIYTRPSLRLLYGLQYSNQQAAFGHGFVESLDQYNLFQSPERHWHSVVAIEAEGWF